MWKELYKIKKTVRVNGKGETNINLPSLSNNTLWNNGEVVAGITSLSSVGGNCKHFLDVEKVDNENFKITSKNSVITAISKSPKYTNNYNSNVSIIVPPCKDLFIGVEVMATAAIYEQYRSASFYVRKNGLVIDNASWSGQGVYLRDSNPLSESFLTSYSFDNGLSVNPYCTAIYYFDKIEEETEFSITSTRENYYTLNNIVAVSYVEDEALEKSDSTFLAIGYEN